MFGSFFSSSPLEVHLEDHDSLYEITCLLPEQVKKENLSIKHSNGLLTIIGKVEQENKQKSEYSKSSFLLSSSIFLPANADPNTINAKVQNGKLKISIGKTEKKQRQEILIE